MPSSLISLKCTLTEFFIISLLYLKINLILFNAFSTVTSSVSRGSFRFALYILFLITPQLTMFCELIAEFCRVIIVSSVVLNFVLLKLIFSTVPDTSPISTQSPIANGLSQNIESPENTSLKVSIYSFYVIHFPVD